MKIRIIKASLPTYWYANLIGHVFEAERCLGGYDILEHSDKFSTAYVGYDDCELIEDACLSSCLDEAKACICGERQDQYGAPEDSFKLIAGYWSTYLGRELSALDVAHMMTLLKVARMSGQGFRRDNYVDACGYMAIAADRIGKAKPGGE